MKWRRLGALLGALTMVGAFATDAFAQRFDRDERRRYREREWVLLGEKTVGFRVDRDSVRINHPEDWYRTRSFRSLHIVADRNDVYFLGIELVYLNGYSERFRVDRLLRDGEDFPIDLRGERSFIREIVMTYRSRPDFRGEAVIRVYGEPSRRGPGFPGPGFPGPGADRDRDRDRDDRWVELGCQRVSLFGKDRDSIRVGRREGRFKAVRLHVRGADVEILDLRVIYTNGEPDDIQVRHFIRQGDRTRPLDLRGRERSIDRVEMVYRTVPNFKGQATVCVEGLD
jgi:hypothetical protein